ncbi:MAG: peptide chain release factor N(5)-glutamine methyltransferase [Bacilli bacterium]|nr:peptide chain release factor N(5)-glutamine methyltransferase [Bacilli bacterium]
MNNTELLEKNIAYIKKYMSEDQWENAIVRLKNGESPQYIIGNVDFYGFPFTVNKNVLIPRFETEELVYKTLQYIKSTFTSPIHIADIGTGSGCIAITLKKKCEEAIVEATDLSKGALEVAKENAKSNHAEVTFHEGNLLEPLQGSYDVIISNPPYIDRSEEIMEIVYQNEPHNALFADNNGFFFYEQILEMAVSKVKPNSILAFEIGETQGEQVKDIAKKHFKEAVVKVEKDMQGRDRFVFVFNNKPTQNK